MKKALMLKTESLDAKTREVYSNALMAAQSAEMTAEKEKKKDKSWFSKNWYWVVPLGIAAIGGIEYLVGDPLHIFKKKDDTPPAAKVSLEFDVYNHTQGYLTQFTRENIDAGSQVTIKVSDLGVSGVDTKHIIVRKDTIDRMLGARVAWNKTNGTVTFTAPSTDTDYDVILLNDSGQYDKVDYWIDKGYGNLFLAPICTYFRFDRNGGSGPDGPILDCVQQLNSALDYSWVLYGRMDRVDSGGNMEIGYNAEVGATWFGIHTRGPPPGAFVHPINIKDNILRTRIFLAEVFELRTSTADLENGLTFPLISDDSGRLNLVGRDLWAYVFANDIQTISAASNALNAMAQAVDVKMNIGKGVSVGFNNNGLSVTYKGKQVDVATATRLVKGSVENRAAANFTNGRLNAGIATVLSPTEHLYSAQGSARIDKLGMDLGLRGSFDARQGSNALGFTIGKSNDKAGFTLSYDMSSARNNRSNAFRMSTNLDLGGNKVIFTGAYQDSRGVMQSNSLSIGANADLSKLMPGLSLAGSFSQYRQGAYRGSLASLGVLKQLGPGLSFNIGVVSNNGIKYYNVAINFRKEL